MKKRLLFFVCFLAMIQTKAQTPPLVPYPSMGLVQGERYYGGMYDPNYYNTSFKYIKDTIILSNTYSYIVVGYASQWDGYYTRYANGKIYYAGRNFDGSASAEVLKYDFTLSVGNTINLQFMGTLTVDSVASITLLNGQVRKYMRLRNSTLQKIEWIDGIGDIHNGFLYQHGAEGEHSEFICAHDNSGMLYKSSSPLDCDSLTAAIVGIKENSARLGMSLSPNPTQNLIHVDFQNGITSDITIQVMDIFGQSIYSNKLNSGTFKTSIDLTPYSNGVYFIRVSNGKMELIKKVIKL
jgi:hypothetical protein